MKKKSRKAIPEKPSYDEAKRLALEHVITPVRKLEIGPELRAAALKMKVQKVTHLTTIRCTHLTTTRIPE